METEEVAAEPLDPVAVHSFGQDLFGHNQTQPQMGQIIGAGKDGEGRGRGFERVFEDVVVLTGSYDA